MFELEELQSFVAIWICAAAAVYYCYSAVSAIPKGSLRLLALLPVLFFLLVLPLKLSSFLLGAPTAGLLAWLCTFRLLLFAFGEGPLVESPTALYFLLVACLPITSRSRNKTHDRSRDGLTIHLYFIKRFLPRHVLFGIKLVLLALLLKAYEYKHYVHPKLVLAIYCAMIYLAAETVFVVFAILVQLFVGFELEPAFNEPYLATSLQDYWGHRWNQPIAGLVRFTIYRPILHLLTPVTGRDVAAVPAAIATFTVSGLMHELVYYYFTRAQPTWEVTWFFVIHGVCLVLEVAAKIMINNKIIGPRWRLHRAISGPLTMAFVVITSVWLFLPQLTRNGVDEKGMKEIYDLISLGKAIFGTITSKWRN